MECANGSSQILTFISPVNILHDNQHFLVICSNVCLCLCLWSVCVCMCVKNLQVWASVFALKLTRSHQLFECTDPGMNHLYVWEIIGPVFEVVVQLSLFSVLT